MAMPSKLKLKSTQQELLKEKLGEFQNKIKNNSTNNDNKFQQQDNSQSPNRFIQRCLEMLELLNTKYPKVFPLKGPRPSLKKGIKVDLMPIFPDIAKHKIDKFLRWYTLSKPYYLNHTTGAPRYDLNYEIVGYVTEDESKGMQEEVEKVRLRKKSNNL